MLLERRLKILIVGDYDDDPRLGSAKVAHKLRDEIRALGHHCDVLFAPQIGPRPCNRQWRQLLAPVLASRAVLRAISVHDYDVIDIASAEGLWLGVLRRLGMLRGVAVICRSHGLEHLNYARMLGDARAKLTSKPWTRRVWYPVSRLSQVAVAARLSDRLVVLNEVDKAFALNRRWKPKGKIDLIPHGVSAHFLAASSHESPRGRGALFCGSWDHVKGVTYLAAAWRLLCGRGVRIPLTILGPGVARDTVLQTFDESARPVVTVIDRVPEARVIQAYREHDLLVFPSTYEGFGLVVLEGMSQGLPVVATPVGCASALVEDGLTGALVKPRDPEAIAAAVERLMSDPAERRRLGAAAAARVRDMSWRRTAERTLDTYNSALAQA